MNAKLALSDVKDIKEQISKGVALSELASKYKLDYMNVYKIAIGEIWGGVPPVGRLIPERKKSQLTWERKAKLYAKKSATGWSNRRLAFKLTLPESTVGKALREGRMYLALKAQKLFLTSGDNTFIAERYGLNDGQIRDLLSYASEKGATFPMAVALAASDS